MAQPTPSSLLNNPSHSTLHNHHFNVKAFGATGDSVTDDTAAIQATLTAMGSAVNGTLYFPQGIYKISDPIVIGNGVGQYVALSIIGQSTFAGANGAIGSVVIRPTNVNEDAFQYKATTGIVSSLVIDGIQVQYSSVGTGIAFNMAAGAQTTGPIITNCVADHAGQGFLIGSSVDARLSNCTAISCDKGLVLIEDTNISMYENCTFQSNVTAGISLEGFPQHTRFTSCVIQDNTGPGVHVTSGSSGAAHTTFDTCWWEFPHTDMIRLEKTMESANFLNCFFDASGNNRNVINVQGAAASQVFGRSLVFMNCLVAPLGTGRFLYTATDPTNAVDPGFYDITVLGGQAGPMKGLHVPEVGTTRFNTFAYLYGSQSDIIASSIYGSKPLYHWAGTEANPVIRHDRGWIDFTELAAGPGFPGANKATFFCRDNGAGKTQLAVQFNSGAVQVIATEPVSLPTKLVEMDLGNLVGGGVWDEGLWDSTFVWGPTAPTFPEDISEFVRSFNTDRGASRETERIEAGTATISLDNRDGRFTPYLSTSPYYPNVLPMRRIRIFGVWPLSESASSTTTYDEAAVAYDAAIPYGGSEPGTPHPIFYGFVEAWPISFPGDVDNIVQVQLVDGFVVLAQMLISGDFPEQQSGERIDAILDAAGWLDSDRDIDAGTATVPAITLENVAPLEHIQQIAYAEGGRFFMARDGKATFRDSTTEANVDVSDRTWADDGTGMSYRDVTPVFDRTLILNDIRLTRTGGVEQSASSGLSQDAFGVMSRVETDIQLSTDGQVLSFAENLLDRFSQPVLRLEQLVDNAMQHGLWDQVLQREITDVANAIESQTQTAQVSTIEGISHSATTDMSWVITLNLSPTTIVQAGIWDDAVYGLWDDTFIWVR